MQAFVELSAFLGLLVIGQTSAHGSNWTDLASLPFAFAVGAFLIWSIVQLLNTMLKGKDQSTAETIAALREQVAALRKFQDERLVVLLERESSAIESASQAAMVSAQAWAQVHDDFRELLTAMKVRPCIAMRAE